MKKILVGVLALVLMSAIGFAADCKTNLLEGCDISGNLVANVSISPYLFNDTGGTGAIHFNTSNVVVDFNNSKLDGNLTSGSVGVLIGAAVNNVSLRNINISGYTYPIKINSTSRITFSSFPDTISNISFYDNTAAQTLTIGCDGSGTISLVNMDYLKGSRGTYAVYRNGAFVEYADTNTYSMSGCSTYYFTTTSAVRSNLTATESTLFFVMIFLIVLGGLLVLINNPAAGFVAVFLGCAIAVMLLRAML